MSMIGNYFRNLYQRTMREAYQLADDQIVRALQDGGACLDCGAATGGRFEFLEREAGLAPDAYFGVEWNPDLVTAARSKGLNVDQGDLNKAIDYPDDKFRCIFGLSVLEHLLNPCSFLKEAYRCLEPGGTLVLLTPNISTYFTMFQLLLGKMPSSGPHPDSELLIRREEMFQVTTLEKQVFEGDFPVHRHLVIFSYRVLAKYLEMLGFRQIDGRGFGLYPFPNFSQSLLERLDPYHCHQMVFVAKK